MINDVDLGPLIKPKIYVHVYSIIISAQLTAMVHACISDYRYL